jgi:hypothetical protein
MVFSAHNKLIYYVTIFYIQSSCMFFRLEHALVYEEVRAK